MYWDRGAASLPKLVVDLLDLQDLGCGLVEGHPVDPLNL
jgi:hypothetical protein